MPASPPGGLRAGKGGVSSSSAENMSDKTGREPVLLEALKLLRRNSALSIGVESRAGRGGGDATVTIVAGGFAGTAGKEPLSSSRRTDAMEPGRAARLSTDASVLNGRGGTVGGSLLKGSECDSAAAAVGESCSLEREYLRKWPPVEIQRSTLSRRAVTVGFCIRARAIGPYWCGRGRVGPEAAAMTWRRCAWLGR